MSERETSFARDLGLFDATMIGVGAMIGAGIFVLTGLAAGEAGPASLLAFALNGAVTLLTAFAYAELASTIPEAEPSYGGPEPDEGSVTTLRARIVGNKLFLNVELAPAGKKAAGKEWKARIDTGATHTLLGENVWKTVGLKQTRVGGTQTDASGHKKRIKVLSPCDLWLFDSQGNRMLVPGLAPIGLDSRRADDVILGMDVLLQCELVLDGPGRAMSLTLPPTPKPKAS